MAARAFAIDDWTEPMAAADLTKVLTAIEGLKVEMGYMVAGLKELTGKVEKMEGQKAERGEVQQVELRLKEVIADSKAATVLSVAEVKAAATYQIAENNTALKSKLEIISEQIERIEGNVRELEKVRWKVAGVASAVGAILAVVLPFIGKLLFH